MANKELLPMLGKLYYKIPLRLGSPLIIGSGADENSDVDVLREIPSGKPVIPATSLVGIFRSYAKSISPISGCVDIDKAPGSIGCQIALLFGDSKSASFQSALACEDIVLEKGYAIRLRDGVKIKYETQTAEDKHKFDYEVVEGEKLDGENKNAAFELVLEITLRKGHEADTFKDIIAIILQAIQAGEIRLGAKTNKGFGRLELAGKVQWRQLDFHQPEHVWEWLAGEIVYAELPDFTSKLSSSKVGSIEIKADFSIKNSLLIRSYPVAPEDPDVVYIKQSGKPTLPGTSVMGAIRHRARKILLTRNSDAAKVKDQIEGLFGIAPEKGDSGMKADNKAKCKRGKVRVEEHIIDFNPADEIQTRIKIDRFTGGTISGALIEEMPLWQNVEGAPVHITMAIPQKCENWQGCLLLLILKDLWTGDLAIGGTKSIGRGVLQGKEANVMWNGKSYKLLPDGNGNIQQNEDFKKLEMEFNKGWKNDNAE